MAIKKVILSNKDDNQGQYAKGCCAAIAQDGEDAFEPVYPQVFEGHADSVGCVIEGEADYCEEVYLYNGMANECSHSVIIEQILREYPGRDQYPPNNDMCRKQECGYSAAKSKQRPP